MHHSYDQFDTTLLAAATIVDTIGSFTLESIRHMPPSASSHIEARVHGAHHSCHAKSVWLKLDNIVMEGGARSLPSKN